MANEVQPCIDVASRQDRMAVVDYSSTDIGRPTVVQPDQSEPMVGMSFETVEAAKSFYRQYAIRKGFGIKTRTSKKDTHKKIRYFVLACAQVGNYVSSIPNEVKTNPTKKIKCPAKITVGLKDGLWYIMSVTMEHCHELSPSKSRLFPGNKRMNLHVQRTIQMQPPSPPLTQEISMDAQGVASQLNSSGLLRTQGLIGGKWTDAYDGKTIEVCNPATGESIVNVACMGGRETNDAISAAYDAYGSWSKLTAAERSKFLRKWYDLIMAHKEELAQLMTLEQGKPLKESMGEVNYGAGFIEFSAEEAKRIYGDILPAPLSNRRLFVLKQPVGVIGAITPWNFPLAMITRKVGPALACGCTVVIKPSELTPLTALAAAELSIQAGIPVGVVNVVLGDAPAIGDALIASPQVRKITFTGLTAVGKKLMAGSAETVKKVSLELGGNAPCIVFDDADLDVAVKGTVAAKFRNSGQTCICANRILVQEGIYEKFANALLDAVWNLKVGDGFSEGVVQGPLINEAAVRKVESLIHDATSKGANVILGGKRHSLGFTFYEPTVISDVNSEMLISREEVFGPVAPLLRFKTEQDAIRMANDTNTGLGSYIYTNSIQRSWRVAEALDCGLVGVNEGVISAEVAPFGGFEQSYLGREGSRYGMDEYLEIKYVCMGNMNKE